MGRTYDDTMFIDTFEHEFTWISGVLRNVKRHSTRPAIIDPEMSRTWTYKEMNEEANKLANALKADGIGKDDVVMGALRNSPAFAFSYVGPRKIGAIFLAANFNLAAGEMALLIDHNKPKVLLYSANIVDVVTEAAKLTKWKVQKFILCDNVENAEIPEGHTSYDDYLKDASTEEPKKDFRPHIYDEVLRLCTSGTTATPKSVPINDVNEVLSAHDAIMHYPMKYTDVTINMTPWFHRGGCHSGGICPAFYCGAAIVVMRRFQPQNTLDWTSKYNITFIMGAPANLVMLAKVQEKSPRNLSSLRGIVTMGAPLSRADAIHYMNSLSPNIYNGYGTTESFWNSFLRPEDLPDGAGSVGYSCTDDEIRIVQVYEDKKAEPEEEIAHDNMTEGEIIIRCHAKSTYSYFDNEEKTKEKFYKGWMYTGDTGTWDEKNLVTVRGRKDDMMVVSGENIYPTQIEEAINENIKVKDSIVTAVPDKIRGQAVVAYVVPSDPTLTISEISEFCAQSPLLSRYKRPRYFALVNEIPMNATGKKLHYKMRQRAQTDLDTGILRKND